MTKWLSKNSFHFAVTVAILMLVPLYTLAISISEYRGQILVSIEKVDDVLVVIADMELQEADVTDLDQSITELKRSLHLPTTITDGSSSIEVDAARFDAEIALLAQESNLDKKAIILTGIRELLSASIARIDELETAKAESRSKDEDKRKLNEILNREEFQKPKVSEESLIQRWIREFFEWLDKQVPQPQGPAPERVGFPAFSVVLQVVIYALVAALIIFLIYKFAPFVFKRIGLKNEKKRGERVIFGERIAEDVSAHDIFAEAEEFARRGEMRLAVRKGYIATLCELSDQKVIGLARHKTNRDYLRDVSKRRGLFENLAGLTTRFERHWYGYKDLSAVEWEEFRSLYRTALNEIKK